MDGAAGVASQLLAHFYHDRSMDELGVLEKCWQQAGM